MSNRVKEKCNECYFWDTGGLISVKIGNCCRYPTKVKKNKNDGCGEFKSRTTVEILREEKKT